MKVQVTPTVDGRLLQQFTTLIGRNGKPQQLDPYEAMYWARRAIQINEAQGGDPDFTVKLISTTGAKQ